MYPERNYFNSSVNNIRGCYSAPCPGKLHSIQLSARIEQHVETKHVRMTLEVRRYLFSNFQFVYQKIYAAHIKIQHPGVVLRLTVPESRQEIEICSTSANVNEPSWTYSSAATTMPTALTGFSLYIHFCRLAGLMRSPAITTAKELASFHRERFLPRRLTGCNKQTLDRKV